MIFGKKSPLISESKLALLLMVLLKGRAFTVATVLTALIMESNQQPEEEQELCSICLDNLPKLSSKFTRMVCCGKGLHNKCYANISKSSMSDKQKSQCIMCRTVNPRSEEERTERIRRWADKGKAWAQGILGQRYYDGKGVDQSYQRAKELFELS